MSHEQCWGLNADRSRCEAAAMPDGFFCERHEQIIGPSPEYIFCRPEAQMPPGLVEHIRRRRPEFIFPELLPQTVGSFVASDVVSVEPEVVTQVTQETVTPAEAETPDLSAFPSVSPCLGYPRQRVFDPASGPLAWLLGTLRQVMEELVASDAPPLQKANAATRLGSLYLRTYRAAELTKENRDLKQRLDQLEQQLAAAHAEINGAEEAEEGRPASAAGSGRRKAWRHEAGVSTGSASRAGGAEALAGARRGPP